MTLQTSGIISINDIATELGVSVTGLSLNDSRCRNLAGIASGGISLSSFYGKSNLAGLLSNGTWGGTSVAATRSGAGTATISVNFGSSGAVTVVVSGNTSIVDGMSGTSWYNPNDASAGGKVWARATILNSTTIASYTTPATSTPSYGTFYSMNGTTSFSLSLSKGTGSGGKYSSQVQLELASDSAGVNILYTNNFTFSVAVNG